MYIYLYNYTHSTLIYTHRLNTYTNMNIYIYICKNIHIYIYMYVTYDMYPQNPIESISRSFIASWKKSSFADVSHKMITKAFEISVQQLVVFHQPIWVKIWSKLVHQTANFRAEQPPPQLNLAGPVVGASPPTSQINTSFRSWSSHGVSFFVEIPYSIVYLFFTKSIYIYETVLSWNESLKSKKWVPQAIKCVRQFVTRHFWRIGQWSKPSLQLFDIPFAKSREWNSPRFSS